MRLAIAVGVTKNTHFKIALERIFREQKTLQSQLKMVEVDNRVSILSIVISDHPINYFKKVKLASDEKVCQIIVGYDLDSTYPQGEDDKIIRMFADWLRRAFLETEGFATKRTELLGIVNSWEEYAIERV